MPARQGLQSSLKSKAQRIAAAWISDFDRENLFPNNNLMEEWQEAAEKDIVLQPHKTLRERNYPASPLSLRPDYNGDFLDKLRQQDNPIMAPYPTETHDLNRCGSETNLLDITSPEDWLKYMPEVQPRDLRDDFYEFNRLDNRYPSGPGAYDVMKEYHDRGWDDTDSPEMSEDKILRMRKVKLNPDETCKHNVFHSADRVINSFLTYDNHFRAGIIVARHLMDIFPVTIPEEQNLRLAKTIKDFAGSLLYTKEKGWRKPEFHGVSVRLVRAEPRVGRWTFSTSSGKGTYVTIFQFIPQGTIRETPKLQVRVSCSCPSWLFWGAQYNATMENYLYGKIRPKFTPPKKRDPTGRFLVCKHVLACIPLVEGYKLQPMTEEIRTRIKRTPEIQVDRNAPREKLRIPAELAGFARRQDIRDAVKTWDTMPDLKRREFIMGLDSPGAVAFFAHRFPETATEYVVEKLKDMALHNRLASFRDWARRLLRVII